MPVTVHRVERLERDTGPSAARSPGTRKARGEPAKVEALLGTGCNARQQLAGLGHDRGHRLVRVDLGTEHQRPVQERQAVWIVAEALGVQRERQVDRDRIAVLP